MTNATRRPASVQSGQAPGPSGTFGAVPSFRPGTGSVARTGRLAGTTGRRIALLASMLVLGVQPYGHAQATQNELSYAGGYLVTGDYAVASVDVTSRTNGFATGTIQMTGVPNNADVLAAFMYWETVTSPTGDASGVQFRGFNIDVAAVRQASRLLGPDTPCYGPTGGGSTMTMFRADVLQFLPFQQATGKRLANGAHAVRLPAAGTGSNRTSESAGATLVVVYRDDSQPLRRVVLYDGISVQRPGATFTQHLQGFYQSASTRSARVTHIVGSGQPNNKETLSFNGGIVQNDPFQSLGSSSERGWSTNTVADVSRFMPGSAGSEYGETAVTSVSHSNSSPYECLAWAAVVFSTAVEDVDHDGLPDGLETAQLRDPGGDLLPNLQAMGATPTKKDLFVEVNAMWAAAGTTYGTGADLRVDVTGHHHLPSPQVLKLVGDAYKNAPVLNPDGTTGIRAHFDVGSVAAYHGLGQVHHADPDWVDDFASTEADEYLVAAGARGGEFVRERVCVTGGTVECPFPDYPGTIGWKLGFDALKYAPVGAAGEELGDASLEAWLGGTDPRERFDPSRAGLFHYLFYGHARGIPKSLFPCLDADGKPAPYSVPDTNTCATGPNPDLHKPSSASGVSDLPGGGALITLGLWDEFVGKPFVQASTTLHELGHNLELFHGGAGPVWGTASTPTYFEPNCKPNYLSVMNYLFQARGLVDDAGNLYADYSGDQYPDLDESALSDGSLPTPLRYRTSWFAPRVEGTLGYALGTSPAKRYCTGVPFPEGTADVTRIDGISATEPVDWNADGYANGGAQDVNFDGIDSTGGRPLRGFSDWTGMRLDQIGAGFNAFGKGDGILKAEGGGIFTTADGGILRYEGGGILKLEGGGTLAEDAGILRLEGGGILTIEDGGILRLEGGGILKYEGGGILRYEGGGIFKQEGGGILKLEGGGILQYEGGGILRLEGGGQELTYDTVKATGSTPPNTLKACVIGVSCDAQAPTAPLHRTSLKWKSPNVGTVTSYAVFRSVGDNVSATSTKVADVSGTTFVDPEELPDGVQFTYLVTATFDDGAKSGASNTATIIAVNDAPLAANDSYAIGFGGSLVVPAAGVLANDADADSLATSRRVILVAPPAKGTLTLNPDGSFSYVPNPSTSGQDSFRYKANDGVWSRNSQIALSSDSNDATVTLDVGAPPSALLAEADSASVTTGGKATIDVLVNDHGAGPISITTFTQGKNGTVARAGTSLSYTSTSPFVGADSFTYTITDGTGRTATGAVKITVVYGFVNVLNVPPSAGKTFSQTGSAVPMQWKYTNAAGVALDSSLANPEIIAAAVTTGAPLPPGWIGDFTITSPGSSGYQLPTAKNGYTWSFNWKLVYTDAATGKLLNLPAGTYLVKIKSIKTGQVDPTVNGTVGALVVVK